MSCRAAATCGAQVQAASEAARTELTRLTGGAAYERWQSPSSSLLMLEADAGGVSGLDLGDSRVFALDATCAVHVKGGVEGTRDAEAPRRQPNKPTPTNRCCSGPRRCADPTCAAHARTWSLDLARPAHLLLMTDGFAALADQYGAYDAAGLVRAALHKGLQELGRELRAIENADAGGAQHPRFKKSDDATALLLRLA
ncbi:MAG: hypothetical protein R3C16_02145 [Hyphomonadaceae bacterium]